MPINRALLAETLAHIAANPDKWDQGAWVVESETSPCGTAACIAGHAVLNSGGVVFRHADGDWSDVVVPIEDDPAEDIFEREVPIGQYGYATRPVVSLKARAQRLFGLNHKQAERLFCGGNTMADLFRIVSEFIAAEDKTTSYGYAFNYERATVYSDFSGSINNDTSDDYAVETTTSTDTASVTFTPPFEGWCYDPDCDCVDCEAYKRQNSDS